MSLDKRTFRIILLLVFLSLLMLMALLHLGDLLSFFSWIMAVLTPVTVGLVLAFIVGLPLNFLERTLLRPLGQSQRPVLRKFQRPLALMLSYIFLIGVLALLLLIILPELTTAVISLANQLPSYASDFFTWLKELTISFHLPLEDLFSDATSWNDLFRQLADLLRNSAQSLLFAASDFTTGLVSWMTSLFMGFIISIYVLLQKEALAGRCRMLLAALLPRRIYRSVMRFFRLCYRAFSGFLTGQCLEAVLIGLVCAIGMSLLQLPYIAAISALISITALVPMIGPIVGATIGTILILLIDPLGALFFLIFIVVVQQIDGNLVYPRIVGKNVGLPPLLVIAAVILGSAFGGILGILVAVPLFSVLSQLGKEAIALRLRKKGLSAKNPEFMPPDSSPVSPSAKNRENK